MDVYGWAIAPFLEVSARHTDVNRYPSSFLDTFGWTPFFNGVTVCGK
jgi:hypothetical protein